MGPSAWSLLLLVGALGSPADPPVAMKDRGIGIPYNLSVAPGEISEVLLYSSIDQGKTWSKAGTIRPTDKQFAFQAPTDGLYWFNVAVVYKNGTQVPADFNTTPPQQRVLFDTQKPIVKVTTLDRVGEEIVVGWEIQEPNAELASMKLEYRPADATAGNLWQPITTGPGLNGQARFRPNTPGAVSVRLSILDTAGNLGWAERAVTPGTAAPITQATAMNTQPQPQPPVAIVAPVDPVPAPVPPAQAEAQPVALASSTGNVPRPPVAPTTTTTSYRNEPTPAHITNEPEVSLDYEIERVGPSGVSKVEVYITQDEGRNWNKWQELSPPAANRDPLGGPNGKLPVTLRMPPREGTFGFRLVPFSGAQLGSGSPTSGESPEVSIQVDRTSPEVTLYRPEPDANQPSILILKWKATDANLGASPIHLLWSEQANGEWKQVHGPDGIANTGRHAWTLPAGVPLKVFLKIVAEDRAGNLGEAASPEPIVVDMQKPVGRFKGIIDTKKRN